MRVIFDSVFVVSFFFIICGLLEQGFSTPICFLLREEVEESDLPVSLLDDRAVFLPTEMFESVVLAWFSGSLATVFVSATTIFPMYWGFRQRGLSLTLFRVLFSFPTCTEMFKGLLDFLVHVLACVADELGF